MNRIKLCRLFLAVILQSVGVAELHADIAPSIVDIIHPNGFETYVRDVNDLGQVAGFTQAPFPDLSRRAFRFTSGTFEALDPITGGFTCEANGINNSGAVVGESRVRTSPTTTPAPRCGVARALCAI